MKITNRDALSRQRQYGCSFVLLLLMCFQPAFGATQEQADASFADQQWQQAVTHYKALLAQDPADGNNWFQLARSHENMGRMGKALKAYNKALAAGYQPEARVRFSIARMLMKRDDRVAALTELEAVGRLGGPNYRTVQDTPEFQVIRDEPRFLAVIEALKPCSSAEHRQFDFWLGQWDVTPAGAAQATASNNIAVKHDGCVVLEQYVSGAFTGMSINFYDAVAGRWHQSWMSNAGGALYLEGGLRSDGAMVMSDADLPISAATGNINKIVWTPRPDNSVQQLWTASSDGGKNWSVVFDGIYRRAKQPTDAMGSGSGGQSTTGMENK